MTSSDSIFAWNVRFTESTRYTPSIVDTYMSIGDDGSMQEQRKLSGIQLKENIDVFNIAGPDICEGDRIILDREKLLTVIEIFRRSGKRIVYTSGVYDLIHEGHVLYLERARSYGDILVVGVDSDELTRKRKPDNKLRPIDNLETRLRVLVRNRSVDLLTVRELEEPLGKILEDIKPDVAIFSLSTKDTENFKEAIMEEHGKNCGEVVFLEPQATNSTSAKIRTISMDGADDLAIKINKLISGVEIPPEKLVSEITQVIQGHFHP